MKNQVFSWVFLIPLFHILLASEITLVSGKCLDNQRSLLLQLKESLVFDSSFSRKLVQWNKTTGDCCKWEGVTCNESSGYVIGLELDGETISDGINSSSTLYSFRYLQSLNLANNNFISTEIPSGLFNLTSLTYLNLSNSGFAGHIPKGFSRMTRLAVLDLSTFFVSGKSSLTIENPNFKMILQNLVELNELYLDGVNMKAVAKSWSKDIASSLPNLRVLSLSNSHIAGPIESSLERLQFLSVIRLDQNNLDDTVPQFLANLTSLAVLRLSICNLQGTFPPRILQLPMLSVLDLSDNKMLQGTLPELPQNGSLQKLVLTRTSFSGTLPESISNLGFISRMELGDCNFSGLIPNSLVKITGLVYLDLSYNSFTGPLPSLQKSKKLAYLDLSHNRLSGQIPSTFFEGFDNLLYVDLGFNMFTGRIPPSLFDLPSLRMISLSNNQFTSLYFDFSDASSSQLHKLDLSSNALNGPFPLSLFKLKWLNILSLSFNQLTGSLQLESICRLRNLTSLNLSYNFLMIETSHNSSCDDLFPQFSTLKLASCKLKSFPNLRNQSRLFVLDLSDNQIGGAIPSWIWDLGNGALAYLNLSRNQLVSLQEPYVIPRLSVLDLHQNQLTGKIPEPPETASYVDYSANQFSSSISQHIGKNLTFAIFFSVSSNNLTGTIPDSICDASDLQVLDLSNNGFGGMIPSCLLGQRESLAVLNLGNNILTGHINGTFSENCSLKTLDLHANYLEANVPESLSNCTMLEVLNFGNNRISDTFPCFLRNSSNLRVLVLRSNQFHGDIQCPGPRSHWSNLQIIDIASNNFKGRVPLNFFFNWTEMMVYKDDRQLELDHIGFDILKLDNLYYQDNVTVTIKGQEVELVKILRIFNSIDISSNQFEGNIPETIGELKILYLLNLSHNAFTGSIPSSVRNLKQLEALDLSANKLSGKIPVELGSLNFLSYLNLSYNKLSGQIPYGSQFMTFDEGSFRGNSGLCGIQLNISCDVAEPEPSPGSDDSDKIEWEIISAEIGFVVGLSIVVLPLLFYPKWRRYYYEHVDRALSRIPGMQSHKRRNRGQRKGDRSRRVRR